MVDADVDAEAADGRASVSGTGLKAAGAAADGRTSVSATGPKAAGAPVAGDALCRHKWHIDWYDLGRC